MTAVEEARVEQEPIIRPDGKEKVTGTGRYTADLMLAGQLRREVPLCRSHACAHPADRHGPGARAAGCARSGHARGRARSALRRHGQGPPPVRKGHGPLRRRHRRRSGRDHGGDRGGGRRADRDRLRAAAGGHRLRGGARRRRDPRSPRLGELRGRGGSRPRSQHARLLDDRQGRRRLRRSPARTSS